MFAGNSFHNIKSLISGYTTMAKEYLKSGWSGYLMTLMFNQLPGSPLEKHQQMKSQIEDVYASLLTRLIRRPHAHDANPPVLLSAPDWPVPKKDKQTISEILTNGGLHYHGIFLIAPPDRHHRLKGPLDQHFCDQQNYYTRDGLLRSIDAKPFPLADAEAVVDYALKGLKTGRIDYDEGLLLLPSNHPRKRPYIKGC
jgi:hypothetical protein